MPAIPRDFGPRFRRSNTRRIRMRIPALELLMLRWQRRECRATSVLFRDGGATVLWYQARSRVVPGCLQGWAGLGRVETAFHPIANTYTARVFGVSGQVREGGAGEVADRFRL